MCNTAAVFLGILVVANLPASGKSQIAQIQTGVTELGNQLQGIVDDILQLLDHIYHSIVDGKFLDIPINTLQHGQTFMNQLRERLFSIFNNLLSIAKGFLNTIQSFSTQLYQG